MNGKQTEKAEKQPFFRLYLQWGLITPENAELLRSLSAQYARGMRK